MRLIKIHQKGIPVLIQAEDIKIVYKAIKGGGSLIITGQEGHDLHVDETQEEILDFLEDANIEVDIVAND